MKRARVGSPQPCSDTPNARVEVFAPLANALQINRE
jgi:hypothetical protein